MKFWKKNADMNLINSLKDRERELIIEKAKLQRVIWDQEKIISYLLRRPHLESGSLEMAAGDEMCAKHGIKPWNKY